MRFAFLILAHTAPEQLAALLDRLLPASTDDFAVLHVDARSAISDSALAALCARHGDRLILVARQPIYWGHCSIVEATVRMMAAALDRPFTHAHLLSGADWPIASRAQIVADLTATPTACAMQVLGDVQSDRMGLFQFHDEALSLAHALNESPPLNERIRRKASKLINRALRQAGRRRRNPFGAGWIKSSQWWSLPRDAVACVVSEMGRVPARRWRYTECADEHVIQTIIWHHFRSSITRYRRFIDFPADSYSPNVLTRDHLPAVLGSGGWFARKVDAQTDAFFLTAFPDFDEALQLAI